MSFAPGVGLDAGLLFKAGYSVPAGILMPMQNTSSAKAVLSVRKGIRLARCTPSGAASALTIAMPSINILRFESGFVGMMFFIPNFFRFDLSAK